ncbi:capsid [uncultured virus]|uniref:Capsid n=1 Tax=uncultured virus TaxID=340016 RepID=A0A2K9LS14_9VIRU|nr:capsid [uncultured virus]
MPRKPSTKRRFAGSRFPKTGRTVFSRPRVIPTRTGGFPSVRSRILSLEKKFVDVAPAAYAADTTGTVTALNLTAIGTDFNNRIGRKILMKYVYVTGIIKPVDTSTVPAYCRVLIVYDNQPNATLAAMTDLLVTANSIDQLNLNNRDRFKVIADKRYAIGGVSDTATQSFSMSPTVVPVKIFRRLNMETVYGGTTAAIGSVNTGALLMFTIGDVAANTGGSFALSTRVRFTDT